MIPTQPSATAIVATSHFGALGQKSFTRIATAAPLQTTARIEMRQLPRSTISPNGVYVPAISAKIIAWSIRRIHGRIRGFHITR